MPDMISDSAFQAAFQFFEKGRAIRNAAIFPVIIDRITQKHGSDKGIDGAERAPSGELQPVGGQAPAGIEWASVRKDRQTAQQGLKAGLRCQGVDFVAAGVQQRNGGMTYNGIRKSCHVRIAQRAIPVSADDVGMFLLMVLIWAILSS